MIKPIALSRLTERLPESLGPRLVNGDTEFTKVSTDTRTLEPGALFIALRGENFDGNTFVQRAVQAGACAVVVEKECPDINVPQLIVYDTLAALGHLGALNRDAFTGAVIAITGSTGKTTVKTMVAEILKQMGPTLATRGNLNNHIGVPLTLLELESQHRYAVIEVGASALGEVAYLCSLAKPDVALINNVMPAHISGFGSLENIAKAKGEVYRSLGPNGTAVINFDDVFAPRWRVETADRNIIGVSLYEPAAQCRAEAIEQGDDEINFQLVAPAGKVAIQLRGAGQHTVCNALTAAACALAVGASLTHIQNGLRAFAPIAGRQSRARGYAGALIIDDSYNANPGSVRAAIDVLARYDEGQILVLGDMGELGDEAEALHREMGRYAAESGIKSLFTLGPFSAWTAQEFGAGAHHYETHDALISALKEAVGKTSKVLIKGSRSARMDLVVRGLSESGEQK